MAAEAPTLGIMQLMNTPVDVPGSMGHRGSWAYPVRFRQVPEAWTHTVVGEGDGPYASYATVAREMAAEGATALITNCGFNARFQPRLSAEAEVPMALSSLLLVPLLVGLLPPGGKLGVVTYDSNALTETHFNGAGWSRKTAPVEVVGIEGSESWKRMADPDTRLTVEMVERDVVAAVRRLRAAHPEVRMILLECSAFPIAAAAVRRETGLPTADFVGLGHLIGAAVDARPGGAAMKWAPGTLGVLRLNNGRIALADSCTEEAAYPFPVRLAYVPGAWAENVTRGDRSVRDAYVACVREAEAAGCAAVVTTCGFTSLFQKDMAAAVSIPVASSSLLLVPFVRATLPPGSKIAVLTYDGTRLTPDHCRAAGWEPEAMGMVTAGVEGSESWREMAAEQPRLSHDMLLRDVSAALEGLLAKHPEIAAVVCECACFPVVAPALRARFRLPVYDYMTMARTVMGMAAPRAAEARAAAE